MSYLEINKKVEELEKSGKYEKSQLEAIKYASHMPNFNEILIMDPSIPSNFMLMYVKIAVSRKIDVSKYIHDKWHLKGFDEEQLYILIFYDSKGYDISTITPNMSVDEIKEFINKKMEQEEKRQLFQEAESLNDPQVEMIRNLNLDLRATRFLLKQIQAGYDLSGFLRPNLNQFSTEQIYYLFTVYSTGGDLERIYNPYLTVDQMRTEILKSPESIEFLQEIIESHNSRKK